ncbi:hypothetical protein [Romboutsia lituseburensis]|uniref:hypothetical protein n=1 Tax=Romboutsia lituseburensis TaxID=1537 RepID=UPI00215B2A89|nr:hypothetical protein [Romboutsia lituseburensis]MCR8744604.1 hypothetical protein [Romboutsia lituseburensis]
MSFDPNYGTCSVCGSTGGCSCGCSGGYDYSSCSPDYNPVTVNNTTNPTVDGSTGTGGSSTSSGNNSSVNVSLGGFGGSDKGENGECCCKNGVKKLLDYLYKESLELDPNPKTSSICIYGNIIPSDITENSGCDASALLQIQNNNDIQTTSITNDVIKLPNVSTVSLCSISVIKFLFETVESAGTTIGVNVDSNFRKEFFYTPKCGCCCDCADGVAQSLYFTGLGLKYSVTLENTFDSDTSKGLLQGILGTEKNPAILIAIDCDMAIFSSKIDNETVYYGVPTCKIAKFINIRE